MYAIILLIATGFYSGYLPKAPGTWGSLVGLLLVYLFNYFSLPVYFGVINSVEISSFWNLLGRIYNLQQGKRLFGMLSSGEHIATVLTGLFAPVLIAWAGTAIDWAGMGIASESKELSA